MYCIVMLPLQKYVDNLRRSGGLEGLYDLEQVRASAELEPGTCARALTSFFLPSFPSLSLCFPFLLTYLTFRSMGAGQEKEKIIGNYGDLTFIDSIWSLYKGKSRSHRCLKAQLQKLQCHFCHIWLARKPQSQLRFKGRGTSSGTVEKNLQPFFLSHTSLVFCSYCSLNTFNRVILFLELENYSSFEIQKFLISRQIRKLKEDRKKIEHTFVIFLKDVNSNISQFSSVTRSYPTLWPHGLQHARLSCPSPTHKAWSNSCPSSQWSHPTILPSVVPFSSCLQSSPASGSFPVSQFFASGGQSIGVAASALVLPMNIQDWFPLGWTGWISQSRSRVWRLRPQGL